MGYRGNCGRGLLAAALCASFTDIPAASQIKLFESPNALVAEDQSAPDSSQRRPREVRPPRNPIEQGRQLGVLVGINVLPWAEYNYDTRIALSNGQQLQYAGGQGSPGMTVFAAGSLKLPGALRRVTVGAQVNAGGLYSVSRSVIPEGAFTPFPRQTLQDALRYQHPFGQGWHASFSPYVEHDIWYLSENRLRVGYQYWRQSGAYEGAFSPGLVSSSVAGYHVRMNYSSHLFRFSLNNHLYFDDLFGRTDKSQRSNRKSGLIRQMGVSAGTHKTIIIFFAIGPIWAF